MWDIHINKMKKDNKEIYIYDNVFPTHHTQKFYNFISTSYFTISFNDSECKDYPHPKLFGASYSKTDIENIEILKLLPKNIKDKFNMTIDTNNRCLVNAVTSNGIYSPHDDAGNDAKWSMIYYANLKWDLEWGGDTLFLNDDRTSIYTTVQCVPNRVVVFDASIPHLIRPSTQSAPPYRFSINMTFK